MNVKLSQLFGFSRAYHPRHHQSHHQYFYQKAFGNFSVFTWECLVSKLKKEFPSVARRLEDLERFQNEVKMMASFLGRECSPIVAQRAFRSYRMLQLHSKLWSYSSKHPVTKRALFSFVILSLCKANDTLKLAIEDSELSEHIRDLDFIRELTAATVVCPNCKDRLAIDKKVAGIEYCHCPETDENDANFRRVDEYSWIPFAETADLLIWRQPHPDNNGCFIYKVYGYYDDISAEDFLEAQLDIEYRKLWDDTACKLEVVESFPETQSDIIYWEMKWPRMFANRDYLFVRRHKVEQGGKNMVIMSKAVTHWKVPERKGIHRVKEYWSVMHIKAAKGISQPGVEFGLTYFDNPGVSLPQWLCSWAAMTGIPEFLDKQRNAARVKRLAREASPKSSIAVSSSKSHFSDTKRPSSPKPSPPRSPPTQTKSQGDGKDVPVTNDSVVDNSTTNNINSNIKIETVPLISGNTNKSNNENNNSANPSSQPSSAVNVSTKQSDGKSELLSEFFKEHILEVHS